MKSLGKNIIVILVVIGIVFVAGYFYATKTNEYTINLTNTIGTPEITDLLVILSKKEYVEDRDKVFENFIQNKDVVSFVDYIESDAVDIGEVDILYVKEINFEDDSWSGEITTNKIDKHVTVFAFPRERKYAELYLRFSQDIKRSHEVEGLLQLHNINNNIEVPYNIYFSLD